MINNDRIVPIQKVDLLTMVGIILGLNGTSYNVVASSDVEGDFSVTGTGDVGNLLADQPVQALDFASGVTAAVVYFVAAYDYKGFSINGTAVTPTGSVDADGVTLYKATLSSGSITIAAVSPVAD